MIEHADQVPDLLAGVPWAVALSPGARPGDEGAPPAYKVLVSAGGQFWPGLGGPRIALWVWLPAEQQVVAPALLDHGLLRDRLLGGSLPVVRSRWRAGAIEVDLRIMVDAMGDRWDPLASLVARLTNRGSTATQAVAWLVAHSGLPGARPAQTVELLADGRLLLDDRLTVIGDQTPDAWLLETSRAVTPSALAQSPAPQSERRLTDARGQVAAALGYRLDLAPGAVWESGWDLPLAATGSAVWPALGLTRATPVAVRAETLADAWRERLARVTIALPEARFGELFLAATSHAVGASEGGQPRLTALGRDIMDLRGGAQVLNLLDKSGLHDLARPGVEAGLARPWDGPHGPALDQPGLVLWAARQHYALTGDATWLAEVWPTARDLADEALTLLSAAGPVARATRGLPFARRWDVRANRVCLAASDGLAQPDGDQSAWLYWHNAWLLAGLRSAAVLARAVGEGPANERFVAGAQELATALARPSAGFGRHALDFGCALWPTGARTPLDPATSVEFARYWREHREPHLIDAGGWPDPHLAAAEAHGHLWLGRPDRAWAVLDRLLANQDQVGLYGWSTNQQPSLPNTWACAEAALLVRSLLVWDDRQGGLVLGAGLRPEWLPGPDSPAVGLAGAPTHHGLLWWELAARAPGRWQLSLSCEGDGPPAGYRLRLPLPPRASVELDGVGLREEHGEWRLPAGRQYTVSVALD